MDQQKQKTQAENITIYSKTVRNRINRNLGHLARVKKMIDTGADFTSVMLQLAAVRSALSSTANELMRCEMDEALQEAHELQDTQRLDNAFYTVRKYFSK